VKSARFPVPPKDQLKRAFLPVLVNPTFEKEQIVTAASIIPVSRIRKLVTIGLDRLSKPTL
jgi:hypothetical protein